MVEPPARYGGEPVREEVLGYGGQSITEHEKDAVVAALEGDYITRGPMVEEFEERVAEFVGVDHAIATTSGTTALHLAGEAAGFGPGDEVITTPLTFIGTAHSATYTGATPVLADVEYSRRTLDPAAVREQITDETVGLVPMHYAGHPADIEGLLAVADEHDLTVIWDACHAIGGTWRDEAIGAQRDMAVFSFHPVKSVTTGEGGMVVTDDEEFAEQARQLRSFAMNYDPKGYEEQPWYQVAEREGYNYNVTEMQAALGLAQFDRLEAFKEQRDEIIGLYNEAIEEIEGIQTPPEAEESDPMYHLYVIEIEKTFGFDRGEFVRLMHDENIGVQVHYVPLHHHPYMQDQFGYTEQDFPVTNRVYEGIVSLPLFPEMDDEDVEDVIEAVRKIKAYVGSESE